MEEEKNELANKPRKRGGRPRLSPEKQRAKIIGVPVNEAEERIILRKAALMRKKSTARYLRDVGVGYRPPPRVKSVNLRAHRDLGRVAANLNQVLLLINKGRMVELAPQLVQQIFVELRVVLRRLVGGEGGGDCEDK